MSCIYSRVITPNQTRGICPGNGDIPECSAEDTTPCNGTTNDPHKFTKALYHWKSQGIFTGNCAANGRCKMFSWCPLENDSNPEVVNGIGDFTTFVKVDVKFCFHIFYEFVPLPHTD